MNDSKVNESSKEKSYKRKFIEIETEIIPCIDECHCSYYKPISYLNEMERIKLKESFCITLHDVIHYFSIKNNNNNRNTWISFHFFQKSLFCWPTLYEKKIPKPNVTLLNTTIIVTKY